MRHTTCLSSIVFGSLLGLTAACDSGNDVTPELIEGGGIHNPGIDGEVNVYVIDADSDQPLEAAEIRVGDQLHWTDADGLAVITGVSGPQTITVIASLHTPTTWVGANGANVTIPVDLLDPELPTEVPQATLSGTITGFTALVPPQGHAKVALVGFSRNHDDDDPANEIATPGEPPPNACINGGIAQPPPPCSWVLNSRTGPQALFALIGNFEVATETITIDGFAYATGIAVSDGVDQADLVLEMADADDLIDPDLSLPSAPAGTDTVQALIRMDLGADGQLLLPQAGDLVVPVPDASLFPGSSYEVIGVAQAETDATQSVVITRGVTDLEDAAVGAFQPLPTGLSAEATAFSFTAVDGATLHTFAIVDPSDDRTVWAVSIFDGSVELGLIEGVNLPDGALDLRVSAIEVPDADLDNFALDDVVDTVTRVSQDYVTFTN